MSSMSSKATEYYKKETTKIFIFSRPLKRMMIDLIKISYELIRNTNFKYLLIILYNFFK